MALNPINTTLNSDEYAKIQNEIESIADSLERSIKSQSIVLEQAKNIRGTYKDLSSSLKNINDLQTKLREGTLKTQSVSERINKLTAIENNLQNQIAANQGKKYKAIRNTLESQKQVIDSIRQELVELEEANKMVDERVGLTGKLLQGLNKIPGLNKILKLNEANQEMRKAAVDGESKFKIAFKGIKTAFDGSGITEIFTVKFFLDAAFKADKQIVELQKSLVKTRSEAQGIRESFINMSNGIGDAFINTNKLLEANTKLGQQLGFNKVFSQDMNVEFINLVDKMGIAEDSVGGLAKMSLATGKSMKSIKEQSLGAAQAVSAQVGVQLDNRKILEATGKVSGQLLANFQANPAAIAKAVAQAQALGTSLEEVKQQGEALLNFESSIESELKAELLLGKSLNLERARAAALMGDQETVMKELNAQGVDWDKFSKMNVVAQKAYAEALGLSADKLSDQLLQQKYINASKSEVIALEGEEVAKRLESLTAQQKFNAAIEKLQTLVANLVDGPLGTLLNIVSDVAGVLSKIVAFFEQSTFGKIIGRGLIGMGAGAAIGGPWGAAIGLAGGITSGVFSPSSMNDGIMDPNGKVLYSGAEGAISLNKNDTVIAGTNLTDSSNVNSSTSIDLTPMVQAINEVKNAVNKLYSKDSNVYLDGKLVGNTLYQGTYKVI